MRRLISTREAEQLVKAQQLLSEIERRCEKAVDDDDLAAEDYLVAYRTLCVGRAAEAALLAREGVFNVLNTLVSQCEQNQIEGFIEAPIHGDD